MPSKASADRESGAPSSSELPTVADVMTREVSVVRDDDSLAFAGQILLWRRIRHVVILDRDDRVVGMLSDRDLLCHVLEGPAGSRPVKEIMASPVESATPTMTIDEASAILFSKRIDALPVMEAGKLVGILTTSDVLASRGRALRRASATPKLRAGDIMHARVIAAHPTDSLGSAIQKLLDARIRHLPVVDDDHRVVGMLTDRDVRTAIGDPRESLAQAGTPGDPLVDVIVDSVMTRDPVTVFTNASVYEVAGSMIDERVGAVAVVRDDGTLTGIISYVDVLAHFIGRQG